VARRNRMRRASAASGRWPVRALAPYADPLMSVATREILGRAFKGTQPTSVFQTRAAVYRAYRCIMVSAAQPRNRRGSRCKTPAHAAIGRDKHLDTADQHEAQPTSTGWPTCT
jgi:pyruvate/2-oxoglutarate/acetoin dehydrogenase E1 component